MSGKRCKCKCPRSSREERGTDEWAKKKGFKDYDDYLRYLEASDWDKHRDY